MTWPNFVVTILLAFMLLIKQCATDQQIEQTEKLIKMCKLIEDHLAPEEASENLAVIECGKAIEDARRLRTDRNIGRAGPSSRRPSSSSRDLARKRQELDACLNRLVDTSELHPSKRLVMQIEEKKLKYFDKCIKNGRAFIKRITYQANYEIKEKFFIDLIETLLNPLTSSEIIVEDIGIGNTTTVNAWNRSILMQTLNDKYLDEITFNPGEKPHWEVLYDLDNEIKAKTHFCQLDERQMFRMWRYENKDPFYMKFIKKEICF